MMYAYRFYGITVRSEIVLPFQPFHAANAERTVLLRRTDHGIFGFSRIEFAPNSAVLITPFVFYRIYKDEDLMEVDYKESPDDIACTILNVPFSLYFLLRGELLLHCGGIERNGRITAVTAKKGVGKSTLIAFAARELHFFTDDALRVDTNLNCYGVPDVIKLHARLDSVPSHAIWVQRGDGKLFLRPKSCGFKISKADHALLQNLVFLHRSSVGRPQLSSIVTPKAKEILLLSSIVGASLLQQSVILQTAASKVFSAVVEIDFFRLDEPDDLAAIASSLDVLRTIL